MNQPLPPASRARALRIIRIALLAGVLMLGAFVAASAGQREPAPPQVAQGMRTANIALLLVAGVALLYLQRRQGAEPDPAKRGTLCIIAWAVAEAAAMFGAVHYLLVGNPIPYLVGVALMLASFVVVPVPE